MRHQNSGRQLGRNSSHRKAMYRNMSASLVEHELIKTTHAKAKELRRVIEPLITMSKEDTVAKRRVVFDRIRDKKAVAKLFNELGPRYESRQGGYLRILKCGFRAGDNAPMAIVELVDRQIASEEETVVADQPKKDAKKDKTPKKAADKKASDDIADKPKKAEKKEAKTDTAAATKSETKKTASAKKTDPKKDD